MLRKVETLVGVSMTSIPLMVAFVPDSWWTVKERNSLIRLGYIGRFKEQNGSKPRVLSFFPMMKPSLSRKSRSRHLPLATTLFANAGSTKEDGMDDEAEASCCSFFLRSCSPSLNGFFGKSFSRTHLKFLKENRQDFIWN